MDRSPASPSAKRRKRKPEEARGEALDAARDILLAQGPSAITLTAVAAATGMTAGNLSHHFGSAAGLQTALMGRMLEDLRIKLDVGVRKFRAGEVSHEQVVETVFNAFADGGGYLAAWTMMSNNTPQFAIVVQALFDLVDATTELFDGDDSEARSAAVNLVIFVALGAFGDSVLGSMLHALLGRPPDDYRKMIYNLLPHFLDPKRNR